MDAESEPPLRRATIKDVARRARVSLGTVSHVLNGKKRVSPEASAAVRAAVAELGYRPNGLARSLIARRSGRGPVRRTGGPRLVSVGYVSIDYMVGVEAVPEPGARMTSRGIEKMLGGPAANVAAFAAGLGAPLDVDVEIVSQVGVDADSDWALEELTRRGIDIAGTLRHQGQRLSRCIVLVDAGGGRTILNEPLQVPVDLLSRHLRQNGSGGGPTHIHFDGFHLAGDDSVLRTLHAAGCGLSFHSAGLPRAHATAGGCAALMQLFDLMILDRESFAGIAAEDAALQQHPERLFERLCGQAPGALCRMVILSRGAEGALLLRPDRPPLRMAAPLTRVVDATGAGDALAGLFLGAWLSLGDAEAALELAVRGASQSLTAMGAQGLLPKAGDLDPGLLAAGQEAAG